MDFNIKRAPKSTEGKPRKQRGGRKARNNSTGGKGGNFIRTPSAQSPAGLDDDYNDNSPRNRRSDDEWLTSNRASSHVAERSYGSTSKRSKLKSPGPLFNKEEQHEERSLSKKKQYSPKGSQEHDLNVDDSVMDQSILSVGSAPGRDSNDGDDVDINGTLEACEKFVDVDDHEQLSTDAAFTGWDDEGTMAAMIIASNPKKRSGGSGRKHRNKSTKKIKGIVSPDANLKQNDGSADSCGMGGEVVAAKTSGENQLSDSVSEANPDGNSSTHQNASTRKLYRQIYQRIKKTRNMNGSDFHSETEKKEFETKIRALYCDFYSHLKCWLFLRMKSVLESELKIAQHLSDEFDSAIAELKKSESDDDIFFHKSDCECITEECKKTLPV